jgi:hypothetical protein
MVFPPINLWSAPNTGKVPIEGEPSLPELIELLGNDGSCIDDAID